MTTSKIIIMHGTLANPTSNWFPWLKKELKKLGQNVTIPKFPTPQKQTVKNWIKILDKTVTNYNNSLMLVGHSSSPLVICAKLQQLDQPIKAVFFVAPLIGNCGLIEYDRANRDFNSFPFDWELIRKRVKRFYIYRSDNDPYVPNNIGRLLSSNLKMQEKIVPGGGHLNSEAGYKKFPLLLKDILKELEVDI